MRTTARTLARTLAALLVAGGFAPTTGCGGDRASGDARGPAHTPDAGRTKSASDTASSQSASTTPRQTAGEASPAHADRVTLTPAAYATARIAVATVAATPVATAGESLDVPGQVETDPRRVALVSSRIPGRLERLAAIEGDRVSAGQAVAYLYSSEFLTAQADLQQAERRAQLLAGTEDATGARALADAARRRLRLLGADAATIRRVAAGGEPASALALRAPLGGSVMQAHVLPGAAVEPGAPVFTLADLSVVDVVAEVPERALPLVRPGQRATVGIAAFPALRFEGTVERLRDALNPETRTVRAVLHVPNAGHRLRPGMFASVQLAVRTSDALAVSAATPGDAGVIRAGPATVLTVPEAAVVTDGERRFVFVEVGPRTYERREVRVAPLAPPGSATPRMAAVVVQDGLRAGERVVVSGAFTLKSELAKGALADDDS